MSQTRWKLGIAAALMLALGSAIAGYPILPPDILAALPLLGFVGNVEPLTEIKQIIVEQGRQWDEFNKKNDERIKALEGEVDEVLKRINRPANGNAGGDGFGSNKAGAEQWIDVKSGAPVSVLRPGDNLAKKSDAAPALGRVLRGIVCGPHASDARELADERKGLLIGSDPSGGYSIEGAVAGQWIDGLRAQSVMSRAGARTVIMPAGQLGIARIDTDPTVSWHGESAPITATQPVFGRVNLTAKTAVAVIPFSIELAQDASNLEEQLSRLVTNAMAAALDSAGLVGVTTGAAAAPSGLVNLAGRSKVESIGAPADHDFLIDGLYALMAANANAERAALVGHPALWRALAKLRTGIADDETPLAPPADVAKLPRYWTSAMPTSTAILADFSDVIVGIRQSLQIRLVDSRLASNLDGTLVCYLRADVGCVRPASLVTLEGIS